MCCSSLTVVELNGRADPYDRRFTGRVERDGSGVLSNREAEGERREEEEEEEEEEEG
jgi:hypothetical protein